MKQKEVIEQIGVNKDKFKCNICECTFKKKITLRKHQNTKHYNVSHAKNQQLGQGQFGFIFNVCPGKEKEADEMRLAWKRENKADDINEDINRIMYERNEEFNDEDIDIDHTDESEDDDAFLAKYDDDGRFIG